jgi:hypothetical protein
MIFLLILVPSAGECCAVQRVAIATRNTLGTY